MTAAVIMLAALSLLLGGGLLFAAHGWVDAVHDAHEAEDAQDAAEQLMRQATTARDDALSVAAKAAGDAALATTALAAANATIDQLQAESTRKQKEKIDAATGPDLVAVSRDVFGGVQPHVPGADPATGTPGANRDDQSDAVPRP